MLGECLPHGVSRCSRRLDRFPQTPLLIPKLVSCRRHHAALDIPAPVATNVVAAASGTVKLFRLVDNNNRTHCLGNVVIIKHGVAAILYAHLSTISVANGQFVNQGQQIGTVGDTVGYIARTDINQPCSPVTGPHLHFELKNQAVLASTNDHGPPFVWGYTPEATSPPSGQPILAHHPDSFGYHDPILNIYSERDQCGGTDQHHGRQLQCERYKFHHRVGCSE